MNLDKIFVHTKFQLQFLNIRKTVLKLVQMSFQTAGYVTCRYCNLLPSLLELCYISFFFTKRIVYDQLILAVVLDLLTISTEYVSK